MNEITEYLTEDHEHCDILFAETERNVADGAWEKASVGYASFIGAVLRHFAREESILFPEFEARTGITGGPTAMMRVEHDQMRQIMESMAAAVSQRDGNAYLGLAETLLMLMRQHNMKEERILYPMADQALPNAESLVERMTGVPG
jgi:hemerythrin-like domain-containing protein